MPELKTCAFSHEEAVQNANRRFVEAFERGDTAAVAALYADDAILLPAESTSRCLRTLMERGLEQIELRTRELTVTDDTAYEVGTAFVVLRNHGGASEERGKYLMIWKRREDGWKLYVDVFNSCAARTDPPRPPQAGGSAAGYCALSATRHQA